MENITQNSVLRLTFQYLLFCFTFLWSFTFHTRKPQNYRLRPLTTTHLEPGILNVFGMSLTQEHHYVWINLCVLFSPNRGFYHTQQESNTLFSFLKRNKPFSDCASYHMAGFQTRGLWSQRHQPCQDTSLYIKTLPRGYCYWKTSLCP